MSLLILIVVQRQTSVLVGDRSPTENWQDLRRDDAGLPFRINVRAQNSAPCKRSTTLRLSVPRKTDPRSVGSTFPSNFVPYGERRLGTQSEIRSRFARAETRLVSAADRFTIVAKTSGSTGNS